MKRNLIETLMGAVVLVVAGVFVVLAYGAADVGAGGGYQLRADFNRATGIAVGRNCDSLFENTGNSTGKPPAS